MRSYWFFSLCCLLAVAFVGVAFLVPRFSAPGTDAALASLAPAAGSSDAPTDRATPPPPEIGGPFHLQDQEGRTVTEADLKGHYSLMSFGYTYCPDVCPATLATMTQTLQLLGDAGNAVTPVFVTVDPARDTPAVLKAYATHFHPRMRMLTGTPAAIKQMTDGYKIYASSHQENVKDLDYLVDHSAFIYLVGPDGQFITHFPYNIPADQLAQALRAQLSGSKDAS